MARGSDLDPCDLDRLRSLGMVVQESRLGRLSLAQLAERAGVSVAQLSQLESGRGNPSVEVLARIAGALGLDVIDLIEARPAAPSYVVRGDERRRYRVVGSDQEVDLMTPGIRFQLSVSRVAVLPGQQCRSPLHQGDRVMHVLSGSLTVDKDGAACRLDPGDSLFCAAPFTFRNDGGEPVECLAVFRPDSHADPGRDEQSAGQDSGQDTHTRSGLIGQRIRVLRRDRFTLVELARAAKVSVGLLSKVENCTGSPSFASLCAIARALGADVRTLFVPQDDQLVVTTRAGRVHLQAAEKGVEIELLVPDVSRPLTVFLATLPAGYRAPGQVIACHAQEFELVLQGSVEISVEREVHQLRAGDAILFDAGRSHARRNLDPEAPAVLFTASQEVQIASFLPPGRL